MSLAIPGELALSSIVALKSGGQRHAGEYANCQSYRDPPPEPHAGTVAMAGGKCTRKEG